MTVLIFAQVLFPVSPGNGVLFTVEYEFGCFEHTVPSTASCRGWGCPIKPRTEARRPLLLRPASREALSNPAVPIQGRPSPLAISVVIMGAREMGASGFGDGGRGTGHQLWVPCPVR